MDIVAHGFEERNLLQNNTKYYMNVLWNLNLYFIVYGIYTNVLWNLNLYFIVYGIYMNVLWNLNYNGVDIGIVFMRQMSYSTLIC